MEHWSKIGEGADGRKNEKKNDGGRDHKYMDV